MLKIKRFLEYRVCSLCHKEFLAYQVSKFSKDSYICQSCRFGQSYFIKNSNTKGKQKEMSYSFEFETSNRSNSLYELAKLNFIGCSDGSIGGLEWKSPIFYSKKSFHSICKKLDKYARFVGPSCGTHLHVGTQYKDLFREYERELFKPIIKVMLENEDKTVKFWGRNFNGYCHAEISNTRYNSFNTRSSVDTLEFRLLKFINAEQYIRACDFCIEMTRFLNHSVIDGGLNSEKAKNIGETVANKYKEVIQNV